MTIIAIDHNIPVYIYTSSTTFMGKQTSRASFMSQFQPFRLSWQPYHRSFNHWGPAAFLEAPTHTHTGVDRMYTSFLSILRFHSYFALSLRIFLHTMLGGIYIHTYIQLDCDTRGATQLKPQALPAAKMVTILVRTEDSGTRSL